MGVGVLISTIVHVVLKFNYPSIHFQSIAANAFKNGLSLAAPWIALVLLLPAPISALNSWFKRERLKGK